MSLSLASHREKRGADAPKTGDPMPPFLLPGGNGRLVSLDDAASLRPAVISFNRGHWCEYCAIELSALTRRAERARSQRRQMSSP